MTILVTGGAGFIGANFVHHWLQGNDETVVNLDALTYAGNPDNLSSLANNPHHVFVEGDIGDAKLVAGLLQQHRPRAILNFAAESHVDRSIFFPRETINTNIIGVFNLLEATRAYWAGLEGQAKEDFRFLHVSTDEVFGTLEPEDAAFAETNQYQPNTPYAASKAAADHLVRAWHHTYGLPVLTTNCSNNYGPFQYPEKLLPKILHNALTGGPLTIHGDGQHIRDWLYVVDHCRAIDCVLKTGEIGETYNVGGNAERSSLTVVQTICDLLDELEPRADGQSYAQQITFIEDRLGNDRRYAIDARKLRNELGWEPSIGFDAGMRQTVEWYLNNKGWMAEQTSSDSYQGWIQQKSA